MPLNHTHQSFNRETLLTQPHTLPRTWSRGRKPDLLLLWMLTSPSLSIPGDLLRVPTGAVWFPSHRISDTRTCTGRNEPDADNCCSRRKELSVRTGSSWDHCGGHLSPVGHLPGLCASSGQPRPPPSRRHSPPLPASLPPFSTPSPPSSCFKIMVAVCFTCLTDSSGSGWPDPHGLCQGFPPDPHCPAGPPGDSRPLCPALTLFAVLCPLLSSSHFPR